MRSIPALLLMLGCLAGAAGSARADAQSEFNAGMEAANKQDPDSAISHYSESIRLNPANPETYLQRGVAYVNKGIADLAIADFAKAIELKPDFANPYFMRGVAYLQKKEPDRAIGDFSKAIDLEPNYLWAFMERGGVFESKGLHDSAIADFTKAITLSPDFVNAYLQRATAYENKHLYELAISDQTKVIQLKPDFAGGYNGRAWAYYLNGKASDGLPDANKALELNPRLAAAYDTRAHIYEKLGQREEAAADYKAALALDPNIRESIDGLKRVTESTIPKTATAEPTTAAASSGGSEDALFWTSIKESADPADYQEYLKQFPKGKFAGLAKNRVAALEKKQAAAVPVAARAENSDGIAVIIGNKAYTAPVPQVEFADNDAAAMKKFAIEALGYRPGNVFVIENATQSALNGMFGTANNPRGRLANVVKAGLSDVVVYYSGHGAPGLQDKRGYLVLVDSDPSLLEDTGYPLDTLYANLTALKARSVAVFIDACFSGESPKGTLLTGASGLAVVPTMPEAAPGIAVLTAARGDQLANWDPEARHGLFTRFLLEALDGKVGTLSGAARSVTLGQLKAYLDDKMSYEARARFNREQTASELGAESTVIATLAAK